MLKQGVCACAVLWETYDARRNGGWMQPFLRSLFDSRAQSFGDQRGLFEIGIGQDGDEFVAHAPTPEEIRRPQDGSQRGVEFADDIVARRVSHGVIPAEIVAVRETDAEGFVFLRGFAERQVKFVLDGKHVGRAADGVGICEAERVFEHVAQVGDPFCHEDDGLGGFIHHF